MINPYTEKEFCMRKMSINENVTGFCYIIKNEKGNPEKEWISNQF